MHAHFIIKLKVWHFYWQEEGGFCLFFNIFLLYNLSTNETNDTFILFILLLLYYVQQPNNNLSCIKLHYIPNCPKWGVYLAPKSNFSTEDASLHDCVQFIIIFLFWLDNLNCFQITINIVKWMCMNVNDGRHCANMCFSKISVYSRHIVSKLI